MATDTSADGDIEPCGHRHRRVSDMAVGTIAGDQRTGFWISTSRLLPAGTVANSEGAAILTLWANAEAARARKTNANCITEECEV